MNRTILIATGDLSLQSSLTDILADVTHYRLLYAGDFDTALDTIVKRPVDLVLVHQTLGSLSGMDLLAVIGRAKPGIPFILIDDDISARTAMASFRLGARDYMGLPLKAHLLLIQIERCLSGNHHPRKQNTKKNTEQAVDYAALLDPSQRAITLSLNRVQYQALHQQITELSEHTKANFIGILDADDNIVDAVGTLSAFDIRELKQFVGIDTESNQKLAEVLGIDRFLATFWEGEGYHVYMMTLHRDKATLVAISPATVKAGVVWLHLKRSAKSIVKILDEPKRKPIQPIFT